MFGVVACVGVLCIWPRSEAADWGSAAVNMVSESMSPSTTPQTLAYAASLYVTFVCDLTLSIWVVRPFSSLVLIMLLASERSSLCVWCVYLRGLRA